MRSHWAFRSALVAATALGLAVPATAFAQLHRDAWKTASIPPTTVPTIPPGDDIIVYLHGGPGSRLEESLDLVPKLHAAGLAKGKRYTVIGFDQPSQGYSSMVDPISMFPESQTHWDGNLFKSATSRDPMRYALLQFSEDFIGDFIETLNKVVPITNRNIFIIGGSTGGALSLRMGHRTDKPWLKKIVAWSAASVWESYGADLKKINIALNSAQGRWRHGEDSGSRKEYFDQAFGEPFLGVQPNPDEWYRGTRFNGAGAAGSRRGVYPDWKCKFDRISATRLEYQEIYNAAGRRWHWRLGAEMTLFSFHNDGFASGHAAKDSHKPPVYKAITIPTLLGAADDDNWDEGPGLHWNNRYSRTKEMAKDMTNTPGRTMFLTHTGHSIHNERPAYFAGEIVSFLIDPNCERGRAHGPLVVRPEVNPGADEPCTPSMTDHSGVGFPDPPGETMSDREAVKHVHDLLSVVGRFPDGKTAGTYDLRVTPALRRVAQLKNPHTALAAAALAFYNDNPHAGLAAADLAVTGRAAYDAFVAHPPREAEILDAARLGVKNGLKVAGGTVWAKPDKRTVNEKKLRTAVDTSLQRAYQVAWALRDANVQERIAIRKNLGWITVSGEDDPPHRPVNVPAANYPQFNLDVQSHGHKFTIRYMVASPSTQGSGSGSPPSVAVGSTSSRPVVRGAAPPR